MRIKNIRFLYLLIPVLLLFSCNLNDRQVQPAFYHWKSSFVTDARQKSYLDSLRVETVYLRFFDVDWNIAKNAPVPIASVSIDTTGLGKRNIIPTVYITNRAMSNITFENVPDLGEKILQRIDRIAGKIPFREIQMDCDWSEQSRDNYFRLLDHLRTRLVERHVQLSATIRLHQIKYYNLTGVPPIDRGMLMFYNMGDVRDVAEENSILNLKTAEKYLDNFDEYPVHLDIALPIFSWGVVMRKNQTIHLLNNLRAEQLLDKTKFKFLNPQVVKVIKSTYINGYYLYQDDFIRFEEVSLENLEESSEMLAELIESDSLRVCFYHLDSPTIEKYSAEELDGICKVFY
ncbi:MAG: hypothetical protein SF052_20185 [Bacteroidia bacterium]|nr:hypothetical protein [Bacteroidia bacterium]